LPSTVSASARTRASRTASVRTEAPVSASQVRYALAVARVHLAPVRRDHDRDRGPHQPLQREPGLVSWQEAGHGLVEVRGQAAPLLRGLAVEPAALLVLSEPHQAERVPGDLGRVLAARLQGAREALGRAHPRLRGVRRPGALRAEGEAQLAVELGRAHARADRLLEAPGGGRVVADRELQPPEQLADARRRGVRLPRLGHARQHLLVVRGALPASRAGPGCTSLPGDAAGCGARGPTADRPRPRGRGPAATPRGC
jgi:hypothetical protein